MFCKRACGPRDHHSPTELSAVAYTYRRATERLRRLCHLPVSAMPSAGKREAHELAMSRAHYPRQRAAFLRSIADTSDARSIRAQILALAEECAQLAKLAEDPQPRSIRRYLHPELAEFRQIRR